MSFYKIKKLCAIALIPHVLRDKATLSPRKLGKRPLNGYWKMAKSTNSKDGETECEKCKKLIEMVFGNEKPNNVIKQVEANLEDIHTDKIQKATAPTVNEKLNENSFLSAEKTKEGMESDENISAENTDESVIKNPLNQTALPLSNVLKATTATTNEEQLAQKLESIEEPGIVGSETRKIDGFNMSPKVLGDQENKIFDNSNSLCTKIVPEDDAMDEIAKKCLGTPPDKLDERILEEMKNCGMLGGGRKKTPRENNCHAIKHTNEDVSSDINLKENTIDYKNSAVDNYLRYHKMKFAHEPQKAYPYYFKKGSLGLIGDGHSDQHKDEKTKFENENTNLEKEKRFLISSESSNAVDSNIKSIINNDQACNEVEKLKVFTSEEEKPKEIIENLEVEVEETRVNAVETNRLGIPGETEADPDFDNRQVKPEVIPYIETFETANTPIQDDMIEHNQHEHVVLANSTRSSDGHYWPEFSERPFINPNTSISSMFPIINPKQETEIPKTIETQDTSISSKQSPGEYFDLSRNIQKFKHEEDLDIKISEIRPLAAFHQYTIISGTDEAEESDHDMFSIKYSPEICSSYSPKFKINPETENKVLSSAIGPLPPLKEELSLSELLKRVRERNRLMYCRDTIKALEVEPAEASKCPPPLDKGPSKSKTLGPGPCKPTPKPCPPPAKPDKPKDPCAKFSKTILGDKIKEAFTLVLQVAFKTQLPSCVLYKSKTDSADPFGQVFIDEDISKVEKMANFLLSSCPKAKQSRFGNEDVILSKDYEPWSPIPSWPIPKKEEKKA